jgi:transcriptional regulator with XRE-family HTH domain
MKNGRGENMSVGQRLKMLRKQKKLSQQALSDRVGLNRATYARYETDDNQADYDTLQKLADFHEVSVDYLLGRTNDTNKTVSQETRELLDNIELSDEEIMEKFSFTIDGRKLSEEEIRRFIAFVRAEWAMRKNGDSR